MRPTDPIKLNDAVALYVAGKTLREAAAIVGISESPIGRELKRRGITGRSRRLPTNREAVDAYIAGESEQAVARRFGMDRGVLRRQLIEAGVEGIRSYSEAQKIRAQRMTIEERKRNVAAANAAVRGKPVPEGRLVKAAQAREAAAVVGSAGEALMLRMLADLEPVPQKAVGRYNVDLAVAPVAVEVLGGEWHGYKRHHLTRSKAILNAGWVMLFVWNTQTYPLAGGAADYAVALVEQARRDPSLVGQYRVIRGDGELVAEGSADDDHLAAIPAARGVSGAA